jgi:hypothetical protein
MIVSAYILRCLYTQTHLCFSKGVNVLAAVIPDAATAGTPIPGKQLSPQQRSEGMPVSPAHTFCWHQPRRTAYTKTQGCVTPHGVTVMQCRLGWRTLALKCNKTNYCSCLKPHQVQGTRPCPQPMRVRRCLEDGEGSVRVSVANLQAQPARHKSVYVTFLFTNICVHVSTSYVQSFQIVRYLA